MASHSKHNDKVKGVPNMIAASQEHLQASGKVVGTQVSKTLRDEGYDTLAKSIPEDPQTTNQAFIGSLDGRIPLTHQDTKSFVQDFGEVLHALGVRRGHRVALVLPNGSELALSLLAISQWTSCVPINATGGGAAEIKADLARSGADILIGPYCAGPISSDYPKGFDRNAIHASRQALADKYNVLENKKSSSDKVSVDWTVHSHVRDAANDFGIPFVGLVPHPGISGLFRLLVPTGQESFPLSFDNVPPVPTQRLIEKLRPGSKLPGRDELPLDKKPNTIGDEALVLFTSGTTGNKKLVPHQLLDILCAAVTIALSWNLKPTNGTSKADGDVNCNLMPLFHVGGIIRQVYSPLVSGTTVICCPNFDADIFWTLLQREAFNWYYASPTMHQNLLHRGRSLKEETPDKWIKPTLRMIANAAGGLLPSLAKEMRDFYTGAAVLPSYGMTECMPISSPPADYDLSKPGTSGIPVGPEVAIFDIDTVEKKTTGEEGAICVRGDPCFRGYGQIANDPETDPPKTFLNDEERGWFDTGDRGYLDEDGYLYVTGRSKEAINRGGETIAPMEVEDAVQRHPDVSLCAAMSVKHDVLQEVVGLVVVLEDLDSPRRIDLPGLHEFLGDKLAQAKWPQTLVFMEGGLPKSQTNKLLRVKLGQRLGLPTLNDEMTPFERTFEAKCPPKGTPLTESIASSPVKVDVERVENTVRESLPQLDGVWIRAHPTRSGALVCYLLNSEEGDIDRIAIVHEAQAKLDRYAVPSHFVLIDDESDVKFMSEKDPSPQDATRTILKGDGSNGTGSDNDSTVEQMQEIFTRVLDLDFVPSPDDNFFNLGGSSMGASQLASEVRKIFKISCSGAEVFNHATVTGLVQLVKDRTDIDTDGGGTDDRNDHNAPFSGKHLPKNSVMASLFQLIPVALCFPLWQVT